MIKEWLGKAVGKEAEDFSRHDKWLCMMMPRLKLLWQFLRDDGVIFISIDDYEFERLKLLMSELFGANNHVATFIWKRRTTSDSRNLNGVSGDHEYVLCYQRSSGFRVQGRSKDLTKYTNPDNDPLGPWMSDNLTGLANATERPNLHYNLIHPETGEQFGPHKSRGWVYGRERMAELIATNRILWPRKVGGRPRLKRYVSDMQSATTGFSTILDAPGNVEATKELNEILGRKVFAFPKPSRFVAILLEQATQPGDIILDSFAGSGTTGHAVLQLNSEHSGNRNFIHVEMEPNIAREITAERLRRVSEGYKKADGSDVPGLGGGFRFLTLGEPIFNADGMINPAITFPQLARHVWFEETREPLPADAALNSPFLGVSRTGTGVYLLFNGILKDMRVNGGNILTPCLFAKLPPHSGPKVIYAAGCRLDAVRLREEAITFKQTPYQITGAAASADALAERTETSAP